MEKLIAITQEWIDAAERAGACHIPLAPGDDLLSLTYQQAIWVEDHLQDIVLGLALSVPLSCLVRGSGSGYGDGSGSGDGDGYGDGDGDGGGGTRCYLR